jgi:hypothetical protein
VGLKLQVAGYKLLMKAFSNFRVGGRSHSRKMKINGINLHSTFPGEIQVFKRCDLMKGDMNLKFENLKPETGNFGRGQSAGPEPQTAVAGESGAKAAALQTLCADSGVAGANKVNLAIAATMNYDDLRRYSMKFNEVGRKNKKIVRAGRATMGTARQAISLSLRVHAFEDEDENEDEGAIRFAALRRDGPTKTSDIPRKTSRTKTANNSE